MLSRLLIGLTTAAGAVATLAAGVAAAQPDPAPEPLPNVNALPPVKLPEYAVMDGHWYAFRTPEGLTCVLQRSGGYGCSGPIPNAPGGANLVSGGPGPAGFATTAGDVFAVVGEAKPLPANTRISYQTISCGFDGTNTTCVDSRTGSGFVITPGGSWVVNNTNPLLNRG
ncbi:hypothetical protein [uncultured Mycolicibacterium sp.]|uniref:hypothetical protein n=1 Tax=uncultured Mycolicibacterium sp. TaxID=2320817 RepID=UPI002607896D|nr:hypothetical protein [uncultured Mycolicibacterium sp.]